MGLNGGGLQTGGLRIFNEIGSIPDSQDLHARYDFSEEDGSLPVVDQTGNGYDLSLGGYSGISTDINGVQAGNFNGTDDFVEYDGSFLDIRPISLFIVVDHEGGDSEFIFSGNANNFVVMGWETSSWYARFGQTVYGGADDTKQLISLIDAGSGGTSELRENGSQTGSGDLGSENITTVGLGKDIYNNGRFWDGQIGEVLLYNKQVSDSTRDEAEAYLADKWGITLQ